MPKPIPAFPQGRAWNDAFGNHSEGALYQGMELRDYFAAQALPRFPAWWGKQEIAEQAYRMADAMMKARVT